VCVCVTSSHYLKIRFHTKKKKACLEKLYNRADNWPIFQWRSQLVWASTAAFTQGIDSSAGQVL